MKLRPCSLGPSGSLLEAKSLARNFTDPLALPEQTTSVPLGVTGSQTQGVGPRNVVFSSRPRGPRRISTQDTHFRDKPGVNYRAKANPA